MQVRIAPPDAIRHVICGYVPSVMDLTHLYVRHRRLVRLAWLTFALILAACNNGDNGGAGDDGGIY